jgi:hypothetical protein
MPRRTGWLDAPPRQTPNAPVIGRPGAKRLAPAAEATRRLTLRGLVRGATWSAARSNIDALKLALLADPCSLTFADHSDRYVNATLEGFTSQTPNGGPGAFVQEGLQIEATMTAYDPLSYDKDLAGVLQWYTPGDTITGENFTRASTATYFDANGVMQTAAINTKRDGHYIGGVRSILLEDARTNICLQSQDFATTWTLGNATVTANAVNGLDNTATGDKLKEDGTTNTHFVFQTITCANGAQTLSVFAHAGERTKIVVAMSDNTTGSASIGVDLTNGTTFASGLGVGSWTNISATVTPYPTNGYYRITLTATRGAGTQTLPQFYLWTTGIIYAGIAGNGLYIWGAQLEMASFASSYIPTLALAVTRAADSYSLPFTTPPQEMTVYAKFVEGGTLVVSGRLADITGAADTGARFILSGSAGVYASTHSNGVAAVASAEALTPSIGDTVEVNGRLFGDGSVDITQTRNGGALEVGAQTAPNALAGAWSGPLIWLNSGGTAGSVGYTAIQALRIVAGVRTLDAMRAIARMPLGTGPVRPLVRITGASLNPVITLYNKAGVAVGSITLTVTTIAGDVLEVDMDAKTVKKNGVSSLSSISAGDFFSIDPADQTNFGAPGPRIDSSSGAVTTEYRRTWR